jgi:regulator of replication initiation timing
MSNQVNFEGEHPQAKRARERAEKAHRDAYENGGNTDDPTATTLDETPDPVTGELPVPSDPDDTDLKPGDVAPDDKSIRGQEDFEHKYRVLRGKYDAEVPRLTKQVRGLSDDNARLNSEVIRLRQQLNSQTSTAGEELEQKVSEQFSPELVDSVKQLIQQSQQQQTSSSEDNVVVTFLANALGQDEFESINNHPEFMAWLEESDPLSGKRRMFLLHEAMEGAKQGIEEGFRTALNIFTNWPGPVETPKADEPPAKESPSLDDIAEPDIGKQSPGNPDKAPGNVITREYIQQFYDEKRRKPGSRTEEEWNRLEAEIIAAQSEGRVQ